MMMKTKKTSALVFLLLTLGFWGCQEEYYPEIDQIEPSLVVQGLITDQAGPYLVRLSMSGRFQEPPVYNGVSEAVVSIIDNDGNSAELLEVSPGYYQTPEGFQGEIGKAYTLQITTLDGYQYASTPQEILPPMNIDSIYGIKGEKVFYRPSSVSNIFFETNIIGSFAFISTSGSGEQLTRFRYSSELYVQYGVPVSDIEFWSCWIKKPITRFQSTDLGFFSDLDGASQNVAFVPLLANGLPYLEFPLDSLYDQVRVVINKVYTLNGEAYAFHKAKTEQMNASGRIFDPIAAQLPGNIICTSHPEKVALGFFEASSETTLTYRVITSFNQTTVNIIELPSMDSVSDEGCVINQYPPFWVN